MGDGVVTILPVHRGTLSCTRVGRGTTSVKRNHVWSMALTQTQPYVGTIVDGQHHLIDAHFLERLWEECRVNAHQAMCAQCTPAMSAKPMHTSHIIARQGLLHTSMHPLGTVSVKGRSLCGTRHAVWRRRH